MSLRQPKTLSAGISDTVPIVIAPVPRAVTSSRPLSVVPPARKRSEWVL